MLPRMNNKHRIVLADNLTFLRNEPSDSHALIYIDPPFNTGKKQARNQLEVVRDEENGDRTGFQGKRYRSVKLGSASFDDIFDDFIGFLEPRLVEAYRVLKEDGSLFLHIDYREAHYCKVFLDNLFGRSSFMNEIIWAYDFGARSKSRWPAKHDTIFWYAKDPKNFTFNFDAMDRIPYMAPGLVGKEKAARGKTPTDVWWHTIVGTNSKEKTGYPTQKPLGLIERIVKVHSMPGDSLLDFFAGSGTFGEAAARNERVFTLVDRNSQAIEIMRERLKLFEPTVIV